MSSTTAAATAARQELGRFDGTLIGPEDSGYDEARSLFNAMIDKRPALIARCADATDVATAVRFAAETGMAFSVRGGGHNVAGTALVDDGIHLKPYSLHFFCTASMYCLGTRAAGG